MASLKQRAAFANLCLLCLQRLGGRGTAREVADDLKKPLEQIQPRFSDLYAAGRIRDTGQRVQGGRGRPQIVWADVEKTDARNDNLACDVPDWFNRFGT